MVYFQTWAISQAPNTITEEVATSLEGKTLHTSSLHSNDSPILSPKEPMGIYSDYTLHKGDDMQTFLDIHMVQTSEMALVSGDPKCQCLPGRAGACLISGPPKYRCWIGIISGKDLLGETTVKDKGKWNRIGKDSLEFYLRSFVSGLCNSGSHVCRIIWTSCKIPLDSHYIGLLLLVGPDEQEMASVLEVLIS